MADEFSNATQSPSPEYTHVDDFFTYFPELEKYEILNTDDIAEGLDPLHPDYDFIRLISLCRWSRDAEKTACAREIKIGEKVKAITANVCPPDGVDTIERVAIASKDQAGEHGEREGMLRSQDQILDQEDGLFQI